MLKLQSDPNKNFRRSLMGTYQLPQPAECVDFQNETMLINEGDLHIVIDFAGRTFKGTSSEGLAKEVFDELVIIQDRKLLIDCLQICNAHGFRLVENRQGFFYIVDRKDRILKEIGDIYEAQHMFDDISNDFDVIKKVSVYRQEMFVDDFGVGLHKGKDRNIEYWAIDPFGQNISRNLCFEKVFSVFYAQSLKIEKEYIAIGTVVYQMGCFKLLESKEPHGRVFYILDSQDKVCKKHRDRNLAEESLEMIYKEKALYHSVEMLY